MCEIRILGIETSCDETAAAVVADGHKVLSDVVYSQIAVHQEFGGVVPEVASRKHIEHIAAVAQTALAEAGLSHHEIDAVAVTNRPGLIGALLVGLSFAKAFAYAAEKPLISVNHLEAHLYANWLEHETIPLPAIGLVVSGGHTNLLYIRRMGDYELLGETIDDAAGEAFDKIARVLGLGYPGGPLIEKAAREGQAGYYTLPRVYLNQAQYDFSFSGLKTAAINLWRKQERSRTQMANHMAAEFQAAVVDVLTEKTVKAAQAYRVPSVLLAGGVAANTYLREQLETRLRKEGIQLFYPRLKLCTDNAAMVAGVGFPYYKKQDFASLYTNAYARVNFLG